MFIYRPIGTQFITDDQWQWAKDIIKDHFGPALIELIRQQPRFPPHKDPCAFTESFQYRHQGKMSLPATPRLVGRIGKEN